MKWTEAVLLGPLGARREHWHSTQLGEKHQMDAGKTLILLTCAARSGLFTVVRRCALVNSLGLAFLAIR